MSYESSYYQQYFESRGVEVEVIDPNDPPAWALGQDPERCEICGELYDECECEIGAWDADTEMEDLPWS